MRGLLKHTETIAALVLGLCVSLVAQVSKDQVILQQSSLLKTMGREDRKFSIHNGNKILTRFYNFGGIGDWTIAGRTTRASTP